MKRLIALFLLGAAAPLSAQAGDTSSGPAQPAPMSVQNAPGGESYTYVKESLDLAKYKALLIKPTSISNDPAADFGGISADDQYKYANLVTDALATEMPKSFKIVERPGPNTVALHITILGAKKTEGGVATATRILPIGLALNAFKSSQGKSGAFTGSLLVEVDVTDAATGDLLASAIRRRAPDALNVGATLSTTDTVKSIAAEMAETLREKLVDAGMPVLASP